MQRIHLQGRGVLKISGEDTETFLQGLISNDIRQADGTKALYAAFLTPQGKYLYDFFIAFVDDNYLVDISTNDLPSFHKRLRMYKLRSNVDITDASNDYHVFAVIGDDAHLPNNENQDVDPDGVVRYMDPRLPTAGLRAFVPVSADASSLGSQEGHEDAYQAFRISLGLPEAPADLQPEKSILLESGFDELNGVDWEKGCYMGQELTARTKYRGLIKKRLVPVTWQEGAIKPGTDVMCNGKVVGDVRSVSQERGIAMVRLDALRGEKVLFAGETILTPVIPEWMSLPDQEENVAT